MDRVISMPYTEPPNPRSPRARMKRGKIVVEPLHVDEVDGCIVLYRMDGDVWRVARDQDECDWARNYEVQSPGKRRFGLTGLQGTTPFVRVSRIEEEPIEGEDEAGEGDRRG